MRRTILVVDDHEAFRRTAASLLEADGFEVVGEVGDGTSALAECARLRPAVVLLDVYLPDIDGFEVYGAARARGAPAGRDPHVEPRRERPARPPGRESRAGLRAEACALR